MAINLNDLYSIRNSLNLFMQDLRERRPICIYFRRKGEDSFNLELERLDDVGKKSRLAEKGWDVYKSRKEQIKFLHLFLDPINERIKRLERTPSKRPNPRPYLEPEVILKVPNKTPAKLNNTFVYVGGTADLPIQNDKSAEFPPNIYRGR